MGRGQDGTKTRGSPADWLSPGRKKERRIDVSWDLRVEHAADIVNGDSSSRGAQNLQTLVRSDLRTRGFAAKTNLKVQMEWGVKASSVAFTYRVNCIQRNRSTDVLVLLSIFNLLMPAVAKHLVCQTGLSRHL